MTNYNEKVMEGRKLIKRSEEDQWRLAELTWHAVEEDGKSQNQWAKDIGVSQPHASILFSVWRRWGYSEPISRPKFSEAYLAAKERVEDPTDAGRIHEERRGINAIRRASSEKRAEIARELLADPQVVSQRIIRETIERRVAADAAMTHNVMAQANERRPAPPKPVRQEWGPATLAGWSLIDEELAAVSRTLPNFTQALAQAFDAGRLDVMDPAVAEWISVTLARLTRAGKEIDITVKTLNALTEGGPRTVEDALREWSR